MMLDFEDSQLPMRIAEVERDTGLAKETLRVWERRYQFPKPERDELGERLYPFTQVEQLRVIRRLLDNGFRPSKVLGKNLGQLHEMLDSINQSNLTHEQMVRCASLLKLLRLHRGAELRQALNHVFAREGLKRFIIETIAPLNKAVGDAWVRGELTVPEEHLYTEQVQNVLRHAIQNQQGVDDRPNILLTTFPDEAHQLGILMVEALCLAEGANCLSLGTRLPIADIAMYAQEGNFDVVALSFSGAYPSQVAVRDLNQFRERLDKNIELWAGGQALYRKEKRLHGIRVVSDLDHIQSLIKSWRDVRQVETSRSVA
jgi:DNA-binding transcriptional MerR regulator